MEKRTAAVMLYGDGDASHIVYGVYRVRIRKDGSWDLNAATTALVANMSNNSQARFAPDALATIYATDEYPALLQADMERLAGETRRQRRRHQRQYRQTLYDINGHHGPA